MDLVNKKMQKLASLNDRLIDARVTLRNDKSETKKRICDIRISIPGNDLFASKKGLTFEEAVTDAAEAIKRQMIEWRRMTRPVAS